LTGALV